VTESQKRKHIRVLVVAGDQQLHSVAWLEAPGIDYQRDSVMHELTDRHGLKGATRKVGGAGTADGFVDLTQAGPEVARRDIDNSAVSVDILKDGNPRRVGRCAGGVELHLDIADYVEIVRQGLAIPCQARRWIGLAGLGAI
jgi:hypothetical protein